MCRNVVVINGYFLYEHKRRISFVRILLGTTVALITLTITLRSFNSTQLVPGKIFWQNSEVIKRLLIDKKNKEEPEPVTHIGFLKVHKAASSTMFNIFYRFGVKHNLNFVVPKTGVYYGKIIPLLPNKTYDIFDIHTKTYTPEIFRTLLPNDSVYIAIVREPLSRMISAAYYYRDRFRVGYLEKIPKNTFIESLITKPEIFDTNKHSLTRNSIGKDFGFLKNDTSTEKINTRLAYLNKEFKLVLVVERMKESLLLMKRLLGWSLSDVIFVNVNYHNHEPLHGNLTRKELKKFNSTCFQDVAIYNYFTATLDRKVKEAGLDFQDELHQYEEMLKTIQAFCITDNLPVDGVSSLTIAESKWNSEFNVTNSDCLQMTVTVEKTYQMMRKRHLSMNKMPSS